MSEETKMKRWKTVSLAQDDVTASITVAINTGSGVLVKTTIVIAGEIAASMTFIPGEHWDAEAGEFVAIGTAPPADHFAHLGEEPV